VGTTNGIAFIATGISASTDWKRADAGCVKLNSASITADAASVSISSFVGDNRIFYAFRLNITGMLSDRAANVNDQCLLTFNSDTTATNYNSTTFISTGGTGSHYQTSGGTVGIELRNSVAAATSDDGVFGNADILIFNPQSTGDKRHVKWHSCLSAETNGEYRNAIGTGHWENNSTAITSFSITVDSGTTFLVDPADATEPDELRIDLYGYY
jgi:hypothetical protein